MEGRELSALSIKELIQMLEAITFNQNGDALTGNGVEKKTEARVKEENVADEDEDDEALDGEGNDDEDDEEEAAGERGGDADDSDDDNDDDEDGEDEEEDLGTEYLIYPVVTTPEEEASSDFELVENDVDEDEVEDDEDAEKKEFLHRLTLEIQAELKLA